MAILSVCRSREIRLHRFYPSSLNTWRNWRMRNKEGLQGLGVSKGIALGQALWLYVAPAQTEGERRLSEEEVPVELEKFQVALKVAAEQVRDCLLYTSDAADEEDSVDLGGRRII